MVLVNPLIYGRFAWLVAVAFVIVSLLTVVEVRRYLGTFAYRVDLGMGVFAVSGVCVIPEVPDDVAFDFDAEAT